MKEKIEKDQLKQISGGCGVVNRIIGDPQCDCSGEYVDMVKIGSDSTGRITYWQCPLCGKEKYFWVERGSMLEKRIINEYADNQE